MVNKIFAKLSVIALIFCMPIIILNNEAHAAIGVDMNIACQVTLGVNGARGTLKYPSQGAWGWRCYIIPNSTTLYSVNVQKYCYDIYGLGAVATNPSSPYSWRCQ